VTVEEALTRRWWRVAWPTAACPSDEGVLTRPAFNLIHARRDYSWRPDPRAPGACGTASILEYRSVDTVCQPTEFAGLAEVAID
jgi:hypothetical protein